MNGWGGEVTLRTVISHAAEILRSQAHIYPVLAEHPELTRQAQALVSAHQAQEPTSVLQDLALTLLGTMRRVREQQQANWRGKPTTGKASDVVSKPQAIRDREGDLKALRKKVLQSNSTPKAPPMPGLFGDVGSAPPSPAPQPAAPAPFTPRSA